MDSMSETRPSIMIRVSEAEKTEIEAMCGDAGIPPATLAKKCLLSALAYYRKHGDVPMPPAIVRTSQAEVIDEYAKLGRALEVPTAEDKSNPNPPYHTKQTA